MSNLSETVPAALRAELARRGVRRGVFAERIGHGETWLYRRLTGRAELTLSDLDVLCRELGLTPAALLSLAAETSTAKKVSAGRSHGRRSVTAVLSEERNGS